MKLVELLRTPALLAAGYFTFTGMRAHDYGVAAAGATALVAAIVAAIAITTLYFLVAGD